MRLEYYLIDLERTLAYDKPYYWKKTRYGYTDNIIFAGLFDFKEAVCIIDNDLKGQTCMVHHSLIEKTMLITDIKANEGT